MLILPYLPVLSNNLSRQNVDYVVGKYSLTQVSAYYTLIVHKTFTSIYCVLTAMLLFERAMREGYIEVSIIKCLLLSIAGVGKTRLLHLLLNMLPPTTTTKYCLHQTSHQSNMREVWY